MNYSVDHIFCGIIEFRLEIIVSRSFSALMLFVGRQEKQLACKSSAITVLKSLLLGTGQSWSNSGKTGRLNENRKNSLCLASSLVSII